MQTDNPKQICPKADDPSCLGPTQFQFLEEKYPRLACTCVPSLDNVDTTPTAETPK